MGDTQHRTSASLRHYFFFVISHNQAAVERLEHTLAKLWHMGARIGQKCPKLEVNMQVDPRFASKLKRALFRCCVSPICLQ